MRDSSVIKALKIAGIFVFLYLFLVSIQLMGDAFKLFGEEFARKLIEETSHPFTGLVIGILATSVAQSSSLTTSMVVGIVAGGGLTIPNAIPIIFGANIGTSVTNTVVSLAHITRSEEFKRAFAAATVVDNFNILTVVILFPIQITTDFMGHLVEFFAHFFTGSAGLTFHSPIKAIVKPLAELILNLIGSNPYIGLAIALLLLFIALRSLLKIMSGFVLSELEGFFGKYLFKTPALSIIFGMIITMIVQSSSVTLSLAVPLAAAGVMTLEQMFPYSVGTNLGTPITALMAATATGSVPALAVALSHMSFNILGLIIVWPIRFIPIGVSRWMSKISVKNRFIPIIYILVVFFAFPLLIIYLFG
jgi:sodium-dependent phosphate cotransporter